MQVINGLRSPCIFIDGERQTQHLRPSIENRTLIRLYNLFTYHSFIGGNSYYDIENGSYYVHEAHNSYSTYAMIFYSGNAIAHEDTSCIEQNGEIIASHNVDFIVKGFAIHYNHLRHYHKAIHYVAKGV